MTALMLQILSAGCDMVEWYDLDTKSASYGRRMLHVYLAKSRRHVLDATYRLRTTAESRNKRFCLYQFYRFSLICETLMVVGVPLHATRWKAAGLGLRPRWRNARFVGLAKKLKSFAIAELPF